MPPTGTWLPPAALAAMLAASLTALPLLRLSANRLVTGEPIGAVALAGPSAAIALGLGLAGAGLLALAPRHRGGLSALLLVLAAWAVLTTGLGGEAARLVAGRPPAVRASLGAGFWVAGACLVALAGIGIGRAGQRGLGPLAALAALAAPGLAFAAGSLDHLSLAVEYAARRETVNGAIAEHLLLSGGALLLAVPTAVLLSCWRGGQGLVGLLAGGVQVIPAVALLGGLVAGVSGLLRAAPPCAISA